jgi:hypothetical protein
MNLARQHPIKQEDFITIIHAMILPLLKSQSCVFFSTLLNQSCYIVAVKHHQEQKKLPSAALWVPY